MCCCCVGLKSEKEVSSSDMTRLNASFVAARRSVDSFPAKRVGSILLRGFRAGVADWALLLLGIGILKLREGVDFRYKLTRLPHWRH